MLVLTRHPGESILITVPNTDAQVEVVVLGVKGNQVRIGTHAPEDMTILRSELQEHNEI